MKINFDSVVNNLPEIVFCTDDKRNIVQVNQAMLDRLGYSYREMINMKLDDVIPEEDRHSVMKHYIKILNGIDSSVETRLLVNTDVSAGTRDIDVELTSFNKESENTDADSEESQVSYNRGYVVTVARDITTKRRLEDEIYKKNKELEQIAITDTLTGLYNRLYFDSFIEHEITKAKRYGRPLSIAKVDIDKFRIFNYMYGTTEGDNVLRGLGLLIKKSVRHNIDTCYRYSGGEFMIIFPETSLEHAHVVSERLREGFNRLVFEPEKISGNVVSIHESVSIGVVILSKDDDKVSLLRRVEKALFNAKNAGGNSVSVLADKQG